MSADIPKARNQDFALLPSLAPPKIRILVHQKGRVQNMASQLRHSLHYTTNPLNLDSNKVVGTYLFGLVGCWGRRGFSTDDYCILPGMLSTIQTNDYIKASRPTVAVFLLRNQDKGASRPFYVVEVLVSNGSQRRKVMITYRNAFRLYYRLILSSARTPSLSWCYHVSSALTASSRIYRKISPTQSGTNPVSISERGICRNYFSNKHAKILSVPLSKNVVSHTRSTVMPGQDDEKFLQAMCEAIERKYEDPSFRNSWIVSPDLYSLWYCTSSITTELFADAFNESGVLQNYCSTDREDSNFSSLGSWKSVEGVVEGAGGNPPFEPSLIREILFSLECGVRKETPYCRCVLLPLGKRYGVLDHLSRLTNEGILLVSIDDGALPFRDQLNFLSLERTKPKGYSFQRTGLFIWRNRQYLVKYPPPRDVEVMYMKWTCRALQDPFKAKMHFHHLRKHSQIP